jgi:hypothetical protein
MPRNSDDVQKFIRIIFTDHKSYWKNQSSELKKYKNAYEVVFGKNKDMMKL